MGRLLDALRRLEERQTTVGARSTVSEGAPATATLVCKAPSNWSEPRRAATEQVLEELIDIGLAAQQAAQAAEYRPAEQAVELVAETRGNSGAAAWSGACVDHVERTAVPQAETKTPQADWAALDRHSWGSKPCESRPWQQNEFATAQAEACPPSTANDPISAGAPSERQSSACDGSALDRTSMTTDVGLDGVATPTDSPNGDAALPSDAPGSDDSLDPATAAGDEPSPRSALWPSRAALVGRAALFDATPLSDAPPLPEPTALSQAEALPKRDDYDSRCDQLAAAVLERWADALPAVLLIASVGNAPPPQWPAALARRLETALGATVPVHEAAALTASDLLKLRRRHQLTLISASSTDANIAPLAADSDGAYLCVRLGTDRMGDIEQTAAKILAPGGLIAGLVAE